VSLRSLYIVLLFALVALSSCTSPNLTPSINYVEKYSQGEGAFNPDFVVYHNSKDCTQLYYRLNAAELLYARKDKTQPYRSKVAIHWEVYDSEDKKTVLDSASVMIEDASSGVEQKHLLGKIGLKLLSEKNYNLFIQTKDLNRNKSNEQIILINKKNQTAGQFFMIKDSTGLWPTFNNYTFDGGTYQMESNLNAQKTVYIKYYKREFPIAPPPFSLSKKKPFTYNEDSLIIVQSDELGRFKADILDSGFVHFQSDTSVRLGYTFYSYDTNFPELYDHAGMIAPMRYISSKSEYLKLRNPATSRKEMEQFWIKKCGSKEKAREVIRKYYSRVEVANKSFTSYVQGWQTDRGMISIIFGMPKRIRRSFDQEIWYYGDENNIMALNFIFDKVKNPFTDNDFRLVRTPNYKSNWYRAVDAWRNGRVYWIQ